MSMWISGSAVLREIQGREVWLEEIVASASKIVVEQAAFRAAVEQYPRTRLTLRQATLVILKSPEYLRIDGEILKFKDYYSRTIANHS